MTLMLLDDPLAERIRGCMMELLASPEAGHGICPSEAARAFARQLGCAWQDLMRPVRAVAIAMAESGEIEILQHDALVDLREARGPVRLRLHPLGGKASRSAA